MPTAILRPHRPEHHHIGLRYHHFNDNRSNNENQQAPTAAQAGRPAGGLVGGRLAAATANPSNSNNNTGRNINRSNKIIVSEGRPQDTVGIKIKASNNGKKNNNKRIAVPETKGPRNESRNGPPPSQKCEPTTPTFTPPSTSYSRSRSRSASVTSSKSRKRPQRQPSKQTLVEPTTPRIVTPRKVSFTGTRIPVDMPILMMVDKFSSVHAAVGGARRDDMSNQRHQMILGAEAVMPSSVDNRQTSEFQDYRNENYNLNTNYHDQQRRMGAIGVGMSNVVRKARSSPSSPAGTGAGVGNSPYGNGGNGGVVGGSNSSTAVLNSHAFPPRRDSRKGRPQPPPNSTSTSTSTPTSSSSSTSSPLPSSNDPPRLDLNLDFPSNWPLDTQAPHRPRPLQRQLSQPNANSRRAPSPGRPPTAGNNSQQRSEFDIHGGRSNTNHHNLNSFRSLEHMSNASSQRSSPVPFETPRSRPPPSGPSSAGPFQNSQPKGLRIRTGATPPLGQPQNRGRYGPDQRYPTDRNGRYTEETPSGMRSPIIQMPLAFNKIATTRQEQTRSNSPTTTRPSPTESFHSSLPNIRPTGRRPTILREQVSSELRSSPRGTSENLAMSRHDETNSERSPSVPRKNTPPPSELRQKRSQSPFPDPPKFDESASAVQESFKNALQKTGSDDQKDAIRSSVVTNHSATTTSASETGDVSGEMSVEDAIGMYESDDEWDPTEVPVIDRTKRTDSGTPLEGHTKKVSMKEDRMSRSGLADFLIKQREEAASPSSPTGDDAGVSLFLQNGINLEQELHDAQTNEWEAITDKRKSSQTEALPTPEPEANDPGNDINRPDPEDTPPRYPPMKPSAPRDRYGFRTETQYVTAAEYNAWNSKYEEVLTRRKKKWQQLLKEAGLAPLDNEIPVRFPPRSQKVKRFVRKGVPPEWRGNAWWFYANGQKYINKNPGLYDKLVAQGAPTDSEAPELIERDLHRTHPDNIHFKPEQKYPLANGSKLTKHKQSNSKIVETPIIQSLRRVLTAFAVYVPGIGYCQSLNFWAGMLLLFMDEEKSFWMLYIITHQYLPGTHERSLEGSNIDQAVLMMAVKDAMPHVWAKISLCLDGTSVNFHNSKLPDITLCTASWLMSGFISNLPIESVLRVWDAFFYEGSKILFRVSLGLFKIAEPAIKAVGDPVEVFQIVQTTPRKCIDAGALMDLCFKRRNGYGHLSQDDIEHRRRERREMLERERKADASGIPRSDKDDFTVHKDFVHHLIEEGEESVRRFRHFMKR
ncbi:hypothetical protein TWF694_002882 [Orbilia ellipsospora]|uniref:Rab-GAP TBC domain-containing protein n=1 Tax=Orbilia ellipsospora TaxID=2528407 RepID=A0AAV9X181_9PEZI